MRTQPASTETSSTEKSPERDAVRGQITVELDPTEHCETLTEPTAAEILCQEIKPRQKFGESPPGDGTRDARGDSWECHTELRHTDGDPPRHEYRACAGCQRCICPVLASHDCLARPETITDGTLTVSVTAMSGEAFHSLTEQLRQRSSAVAVEWIQWNGEQPADQCPADEITTRQQEAVETALASGYYDTPRTATLKDLAQRLEISRSAVSQRLNAAETKLIKSAFDPRE